MQYQLPQLPETLMRSKINIMVRDYAQRTNSRFAEVWLWLYHLLDYCCNYNVDKRCKHSGTKRLDQIEADGKMEALYLIASAALSES